MTTKITMIISKKFGLAVFILFASLPIASSIHCLYTHGAFLPEELILAYPMPVPWNERGEKTKAKNFICQIVHYLFITRYNFGLVGGHPFHYV